MNDKTLAVFTPTYNRAYIIGNLYKSLLAQTSEDFCWIVVDDGSSDNTEQLIASFISENRIPIRYIKQENGGKQRAHNTGVDACDNELFFCVDSDDALVPTAVEDVLSLWQRVKARDDVAGIIAMRGHSEAKPMGTWIPENLDYTTMWDLYYRHHHRGDTALVYRTDILRKYPYIVEPGEKFIGETYVYHQIDQSYRLAVLHKVIWICEYLPDGYTKHVRKITRENPRSYMRLKRSYIDYSDTFALKAENTILYLVGAYFAGCFGEALKGLPNRALSLLCAPVALLLAKTEFQR